ncbi:transport permease protein [Vallitalea longa]|uniref:Transport permease protein n=1 Tax=Vallitalea longa TaxID=2936439 RepID=A0A9W6DHW8_9FIRM|nr:ABC transporter permease [Vallitalea longa]GKX32012.1 transport permease protein [Vallitalea longa]
MNYKIMLKLTTFELKLFSRNFISMFFLLVFPTLMILLFGGIYGNEPNVIFGGVGTVDVSVPAYSGLIISVTGLMSLPLTLCEYREKKILKRYRATPLKVIYVIISQVCVNCLMTIAGMIFLIIIAKLVFGLNFIGNVFEVIIIFILSMLSVFSIGFLIASVAPNMKAANAIANLVYFPMLFLTGATIPIEIMPEFMQKISKFLPVTHAVNAMKDVWLGKGMIHAWVSILVLILVLLVCLIVSLKIFRWE